MEFHITTFLVLVTTGGGESKIGKQFDFCQKNRLDYIEVSALNGNNVKEIFEKVAKNLTKKANESEMNSKNQSKVKLGKSVNSSKIKEENESFEYSVYGEIKKKKSKCC